MDLEWRRALSRLRAPSFEALCSEEDLRLQNWRTLSGSDALVRRKIHFLKQRALLRSGSIRPSCSHHSTTREIDTMSTVYQRNGCVLTRLSRWAWLLKQQSKGSVVGDRLAVADELDSAVAIALDILLSADP